MFLVIQRNIDFYNEFFVVSKYDEMNCNLIFWVFNNVLKNVDSNYMK
jgi:hypothetical protein